MHRSFASDNNAPVAPEILEAIVAANSGDAVGYGDDEWTARALSRFREQFGDAVELAVTPVGSGALPGERASANRRMRCTRTL
jgi:threonine aldolase